MLREYKHVKQEPGPGRRRWWGGDDMEFTVWYDASGAVTGYQLCFRGVAFTWQTTGYWSHVMIGESFEGGRIAGYGVPILRSNGAPSRPPFELLTRFESASGDTVAQAERELVAHSLQHAIIHGRN